MRRTTTVASASAALLCLGVLLTGCGSAAEEGYAAVGAAGPADGRAPTKAVPPDAGVELTPLDGDGDGAPHTGPESRAAAGSRDAHGSPGSTPGASSSPPAPSSEDAGGNDGDSPHAPPGSSSPPEGSGAGGPSDGASGPPDSPGSGSPAPEPPSPALPAGPGAPAGLLIGAKDLAGTDVRWCEKVTLDFLNTGKHPVTSGTVSFGTHVIGGLGVDWATLRSTHRLPLPLDPGEKRTGSWRVCVDAWRVPLGMHLDTRDVSFTWK
ncbi:hypothetical protein [Streptomyces sp. NPDC017993]|uniref:hypothetical protein n=1 Tax=Streptomyces sp. NPDC017993 TaxID=3365027 RepID=UPI0037A5AEED